MTTNGIYGTCDSKFAAVRDAFAANFAAGEEIGAAVAVTIAGRPVVDLWAGCTDKARTRPWERDTLVTVYSTTKGMTAICTHRLVDQGLLDLEAPVSQYWEEFAQAGKAGWQIGRAGAPVTQSSLAWTPCTIIASPRWSPWTHRQQPRPTGVRTLANCTPSPQGDRR